MEKVKLGGVEVSRFILGGNPFSAFSHLSWQLDDELRHWYTAERIKAAYREAERLGVNAHVGRADHHIARVLLEHWDEGGTMQWIAQTCPEVGAPPRGAQNGISYGAKAVFVHGGMMDNYLIHGRLEEIPPVIDMIHAAGLAAGVAGHLPGVFEWAEQHLECDFYLCSYYNPIPRDKGAENVRPERENYDPAARDLMAATIKGLSKPVIHYKVMAAGRNDPKEAFAHVARTMRAGDAVCVGVNTKHRPTEIEDDVRLLEEELGRVRQAEENQETGREAKVRP